MQPITPQLNSNCRYSLQITLHLVKQAKHKPIAMSTPVQSQQELQQPVKSNVIRVLLGRCRLCKASAQATQHACKMQ
jgi:hypothetical protein